MNPVVHFEIPAEDRKRMIEFYQKAFGWETNQLGEDMGNYVVVMTGPSDKNGPLQKGMINGGFFQKTKDNPAQHPSIVISVENISEHVKKVQSAGGKAEAIVEIPGVGKFAAFVDTEGNRLSMLEPIMRNEGQAGRNGKKKK